MINRKIRIRTLMNLNQKARRILL